MYFLDKWGCLPEAGGWSDQDGALIDDIETMSALMERTTWEVEHEENSEYSDTETEVPVMRLDDL